MLPSSALDAPAWTRGFIGVPPGVLAFAALCLLALVAIACGVLFEIGRVRREKDLPGGGNTITGERQFFWRMVSSVVWCLALGLLAAACSVGWPRQALGLGLDGRTWLQVLAGAMSLIFVGLLLLAVDLWRVRTRSMVQEEAFKVGLSLLAQQEIERARANADTSNTKQNPNQNELARPLKRPEKPNRNGSDL